MMKKKIQILKMNLFLGKKIICFVNVEIDLKLWYYSSNVIQFI